MPHGALKSESLDDGGYAHVWRIAFPIIVNTSSATVMSFVDRIFLGWYSSDAMAAALPAGISAFTLMSFFLGTAGYTSTFVAQYYGSRQPEGVPKAVWQGVFFALGAGAILVGVSFFASTIMGWAGHEPQTAALEAVYFRILLWGAPFMVMSSALCGFYNGLGKPYMVTVVQLFANAINVALNYALIFGHWGLPQWGIKGAAIATVCSSALSVVVFFIALSVGRLGREYRFMSSFGFEPRLLIRLLRFGAPSALQWTVDMIGFTAFVWFVGRLGRTELQAVSATFAVNHLAFFPMVGFGIATSVLVGQFLGADKPELARRATMRAAVMTEAYMVFIAAVFVIFPAQLVRLFGERGPDAADFAAVVALSTVLLRFVAVYSVFDGIGIVLSSALRGAGDTLFVLFMMAGLSVTIFIVPTFLAVEVFNMGIYTAMAIAALYIVVLTFAFYWRYRTGKWQYMRVVDIPAPVVPTQPIGDGPIVEP